MERPPSDAVDFETVAERFHFLIEAVTDYAIYLLDDRGFVRSWNPGAQRLKGYQAVEIIGQHFSRFFTDEDQRDELPERILRTASSEGRGETEGWRVRKDGTRFLASAVIQRVRDSRGRHIGFAKVTRDITERKLSQDALAESEHHFRLLVNGVTDYALYLLDPNGVVTNWNSGAERIKGYAAAEIVGQHFSRFYTDSDRAADKPARALRTAATEGRFAAEGWRVRKDGTLFWADVVIDPVRDEQGTLIGYSKITRDATERRAVQKALQETQSQLAQAQKMDALGQLTGGVAHDFNNLLMIISGYIPMLKRHLTANPKGMAAADAIELAAKRGATLTRQLLSFSRRQSLEPIVLKLPDTVEAMRPILNSILGADFRWTTDISSSVWSVKVDVSELEVAIVNLAVNARDAMQAGDAISVTAANVHLSGDALPGKLNGDFVALTVADTGHGIPPDILAKVFDPFFTTKGVGKGTGLGLSQVHGFAHQSGGSIDIQSEVGQGTRVTLYLPRAGEDDVIAQPAHRSPLQAVERTTLLVEDNPEVAAATLELLNQLGDRVTVVGDAEAALNAFRQHKFDLVLTDIVMAGDMNGLDLARVLRGRHPKLAIVLSTGYSDAAAQAPVGFPLLRKPYGITELNEAIDRAGEAQT